MPARPLACTTARHRSLDAAGLRLHALEWGEPARSGLLLLHGGSAHAHWFDAVVGAVAAGRHVIALDQRGHGESAWPVPPAYATADFVADLARVVDELGWDRAVLVGHSMGGANSMAFAATHPDRTRGLVVCDARPAIPEERLGYLRSRGARATQRPFPSREAAVAAFRLVPRETTADPALLAHMGEAGVTQRDGGWVYRFDPDANRLRQPADCWPMLPRIAAPTLIVRAVLSPILPGEMAQQMVAAIPRARLVEIPGAYHHVTLDAPDAVGAALAKFLAEID